MKSPDCHRPSTPPDPAGTDTDPDTSNGTDSDRDALSLCTSLLSSLSDNITAVQSFKGRWAVISTKVLRLRSSVSSLPSHPLALDLLRSLADSLSVALTLSLHCRHPDPPAGKLQTQSEIAAAGAALDQHIADVELLLKSATSLGAVTDPAMPSTPPGGGEISPSTGSTTASTTGTTTCSTGSTSSTPTSRRELLRNECRALVTRLQVGTAESKLAALNSLIRLMSSDDKNVIVAVAQGAVPALLRLLESPHVQCEQPLRDGAVLAVALVASVESCRHVLAAEGLLLLNHLSRSLECAASAPAAKEKACEALRSLTLASRENATAVGTRGGAVASLLEICRDGTPNAQAAAAGVLCNVAAVDEVRGRFAEEEGAVRVLARLCSSGTAAAQENAVACARNLAASEERAVKMMVVRDFGADTLKAYWDRSGHDLEPAVGLFRYLSADVFIAESLAAIGFIPRVVAALDNPSAGTRTEAARAVAEMCIIGGRTRARDVGADPTCVTRLVRMLEAKCAEEKDAAVRALAGLLEASTECRRAFRKEERGVSALVQLLGPLVRDVDKVSTVLALLALAQSRKCRRRMVDAGAAGFLKVLVEEKVDGANRLLDGLAKGGIWGGIFGRSHHYH